MRVCVFSSLLRAMHSSTVWGFCSGGSGWVSLAPYNSCSREKRLARENVQGCTFLNRCSIVDCH